MAALVARHGVPRMNASPDFPLPFEHITDDGVRDLSFVQELPYLSVWDAKVREILGQHDVKYGPTNEVRRWCACACCGMMVP